MLTKVNRIDKDDLSPKQTILRLLFAQPIPHPRASSNAKHKNMDVPLVSLEPSSSIQSDPLYGAMFETYVAQNLLSILAATWQRAALHFWAVQGRHEVDFVIEAGRSCIALELKSSARWHEKDLAGLKAFLAATPHCKAGILCHNGEDAVNLGPRLWALPISLILS
jgi:predicted AAA+ superfamily ATPase